MRDFSRFDCCFKDAYSFEVFTRRLHTRFRVFFTTRERFLNRSRATSSTNASRNFNTCSFVSVPISQPPSIILIHALRASSPLTQGRSKKRLIRLMSNSANFENSFSPGEPQPPRHFISAERLSAARNAQQSTHARPESHSIPKFSLI